MKKKISTLVQLLNSHHIKSKKMFILLIILKEAEWVLKDIKNSAVKRMLINYVDLSIGSPKIGYKYKNKLQYPIFVGAFDKELSIRKLLQEQTSHME